MILPNPDHLGRRVAWSPPHASSPEVGGGRLVGLSVPGDSGAVLVLWDGDDEPCCVLPSDLAWVTP